MVGVTISLGSLVTSLAVGGFGAAASSASFASSLQAQASGREVAFVDSSVGSQSSCPAYQGAQEGQTLVVTLFNYGSAAFTPDEFVVNGSVYYSSSFQSLQAGALGTYSVSLQPAGSCAHPTGQALMVVDPSGDEFQYAT